jgi:hypothetical protein
VVAALAAAGAAMLPAAPAAAMLPPGDATGGCVAGYRVAGPRHDVCVTTGVDCDRPEVTVPGPRVPRAPATDRAQVVTLAEVITRWDGRRWAATERQSSAFTIGAGRSSGVGLPSHFCLQEPGRYSVVATTAWYDPDTGRPLAVRSRIVEPRRPE